MFKDRLLKIERRTELIADKESKTRNELINIRNQLRKPGLEKHTKLELLQREGELEELLLKKYKKDYYDGRLCKHCGKPITGIKHGNTSLHEHCKEPYRREKEIEYKELTDENTKLFDICNGKYEVKGQSENT